MKTFIFALLSLLCAATIAQAQLPQRVDTVPPAVGWVKANTDTISFEPGTFIGIWTLPSLDTARAISAPKVWSTNSGLMKWLLASEPAGSPYFTSGVFGYYIQDGDRILRTKDGGKTCDTLASMMPYTYNATLVTPGIMYLVGAAFIDRTTDSGRTWKVQEVNAEPLHAISFSDSLHGFAVGGVIVGPQPFQQGGSCVPHHRRWKYLATGLDPDGYQILFD